MVLRIYTPVPGQQVTVKLGGAPIKDDIGSLTLSSVIGLTALEVPLDDTDNSSLQIALSDSSFSFVPQRAITTLAISQNALDE